MGYRVDITGKKFGCLSVIKKAESRIVPSGGTKGYWIVRCDCGIEKEIGVQSLINRLHASCGKNCKFKWGAEQIVECSKCNSKYSIKYRGKEKSNRLCRKCASKIASAHVIGKESPNRLPHGVAAFNSLYGAYKRNAIKYRNVSFELSKERFKELTKKSCHYCGSEPSSIRNCDALRSKGKSSGDYIYNGIDRINSSIGYVEGNIVTCCGRCNMMKNNMSIDDFFSHIKKIISFSFNE